MSSLEIVKLEIMFQLHFVTLTKNNFEGRVYTSKSRSIIKGSQGRNLSKDPKQILWRNAACELALWLTPCSCLASFLK